METLSSRKNAYIQHCRRLGADGTYRRACGEYLCDGRKLLLEALSAGATLRSVLWKDAPESLAGLEGVRQAVAPAELFDYASPMKNSPGPLFCVALPEEKVEEPVERLLVLENVQDPGNVGTVLRTAAALGVELVVLTGDCADRFSPKTVRATMGAVFRQRVQSLALPELLELLRREGLPLYGAALSPRARDIRSLPLRRAAVAIGSEGRGLSKELLAHCGEELIIPMTPGSESLNAAVAASLVMWEMTR